MPQPDKPSSADEPAVAGGTAADRTAREKTSGRIAFDSRGNAIWEWRTGDKQFSRDVNTTLVERLESPDLSLQTTRIAKGQPALPAGAADASQGNGAETGACNPYNHPASDVARRAVRPARGGPPIKKAAPKIQPSRTSARTNGWVRLLQGLIGRKRP